VTDAAFSLNGTAFHLLSEVDYSIGPKNCSFAWTRTSCPATIHEIDDTVLQPLHLLAGSTAMVANEPLSLSHWNVDTLNPVHAIMNTISDEL
jgi:hypothetical protein